MNEREANRIKDIIYEAMTNDRSSYPCDYDEEHESFDAPMDEDVCARCKYRRVCQVLNDYKRDDGFEEAMLSLIEDEDPYTDCPKTLDQVIDYLETAQNRFDFVYERNELARDSEEIQSGVVLLDKSIRGLKKILDRLPSSVNGLSHINSASNNAILESGREAPYVQEIAVQRPDFC